MIRASFQESIDSVKEKLFEMAEMVIQSINRSIEALRTKNTEEAERIKADDELINKKRWEIEEECINLIATQQPVATDLRKLIAILNIIVDLERMGDHAEGIAKIVIMHREQPLVKPLIDIPRMAEKATEMIKKSIEAFEREDMELAQRICEMDDEVDILHEQIYRELISFMLEDPKTITRATYLIWAAHNLERIADRVTNICERIVFLVSGTMKKINVSKY